MLEGLRVLDLATLAAAPLVATYLGEFGAEVIKVEEPTLGDPIRTWGNQRDGVGLMWKSMARNKKSVTLNLRHPAGQDIVRRLVARADVVIANTRPQTLQKWGLDYPSLRAVNERALRSGQPESGDVQHHDAKAKTARDVWWVDVLLTQLELKLGLRNKIRLEVLIEEVEGLANAEAIAVASDRVDSLIFGVGDFSLSQGARVDTNFDPLGEYPGDFWYYARNKVIVAARIAGIDAIDSPCPDYRNLEGYERDARRSALYGYTGKWAIHPDQVPIANDVYAPTADQIALARRNLAAYREAEAAGRGAVGVEGVLVDAAHVKMAEETLARVALIDARR